MVEGNDLKALAAVMRAWDGFAVSEANLRQNPVPTCAIVGEIDPLKAQVDALARVMKNLDVAVIPGADHGALSNPQSAADVIEFLRRHPVKVSTASGSETRSCQRHDRLGPATRSIAIATSRLSSRRSRRTSSAPHVWSVRNHSRLVLAS